MTRDDILAAVRVLDEGAPQHSLYEIEDAKASLKPLVRYWNRQNIVMTSFSIAGWTLGRALLPTWNIYLSTVTVAFAFLFIGALLLRLHGVRQIFVPAGLTFEDVGKAARHVVF